MADLMELAVLVAQLRAAREPEGIFGFVADAPTDMKKQLAAAKAVYRRLAQQVHPDARPDADNKLANEAFALLNRLWQQAEQKFEHGTYGRSSPIIIQTRKQTYTLIDRMTVGDLCDIYRCEFVRDGVKTQGVFKIAHSADDNDLLQQEAETLRYLAHEDRSHKYGGYFPFLIESFLYSDTSIGHARRANILALHPDIPALNTVYTLREVRAQYPQGVDPKDMGWIWRRLLMALDYVHESGIIHGAILPDHILIQPTLRGLTLIDWAYSSQNRTSIPAISEAYEAWYPDEIMDKQAPSPAADLLMAARCMIDLMGGDPVTGAMPDRVPVKLQRLLTWCLQPNSRMRPQSAWALLKEFDDLLEALWGRRRYDPFDMPPKP